MKYQTTKERMDELKYKRAEFQRKLTEVNNWLFKNFEHPDRNKMFSDKSYYECEINQMDKKLLNLNAGTPELGVSNDLDGVRALGFTTSNLNNI